MPYTVKLNHKKANTQKCKGCKCEDLDRTVAFSYLTSIIKNAYTDALKRDFRRQTYDIDKLETTKKKKNAHTNE